MWVALGACGGEPTTPPVDPEEPDTVVDSIEMVPPERSIGVLGTRFTLVALAVNADGERIYDSTTHPGRFSWSSSAPDVASRDDATRMVEGVSEGVATITATSQSISGTTTVTVRDRAHFDWSVPIPTGPIAAGNIMAADGTVYVGTHDYVADRSVWHAVAPGGGVVWTVDLPLTGRSTPAIGEDGTLYLGSWSDHGFSGSLIAVDPGGTVRWVLDDLEAIWSGPAIGPDGIVHVAGGHRVYAVDPQGKVLWMYTTDDRVFGDSSPAIASDGTIYVGGNDGQLYAISSGGSLRWTFETGDLIQGSPSIGPDGAIYVGSFDGRLYAVNPDGTERWSVEVDSRRTYSSPSIAPDGTVYVMGTGIYAVDPSGSIRWSYPLSRSGATPVLGADGTVYIAGRGRYEYELGVFAFDPDGNLLWRYHSEHAGGSPLIGLDGTIIAAAGNELIGIVEHGSTNGGYRGSPWPTVRRDRASTGRAGG